MAHGATVVPQLIRGRPTEVLTAATPPDPAALDQLRPMMRAVITDGTAKLLGRRGEVFGKTGTAEYTDDGRAHGWFVGYRGDLAFAVLIVDGGSSGPAVQVAARFLAALGCRCRLTGRNTPLYVKIGPIGLPWSPCPAAGSPRSRSPPTSSR